MSYPAMMQDILGWMDAQGLPKAKITKALRSQ